MSGARPTGGGVRVPAPRPTATRLYAGRDAAILAMAADDMPAHKIAVALGMKPDHAARRLADLRERLADEQAEAEERARKYPGFPKPLPCPMCRTERVCQDPGDRHCARCKGTPAWRAGDGVRGAVAGIRKGRG